MNVFAAALVCVYLCIVNVHLWCKVDVLDWRFQRCALTETNLVDKQIILSLVLDAV